MGWQDGHERKAYSNDVGEMRTFCIHESKQLIKNKTKAPLCKKDNTPRTPDDSTKFRCSVRSLVTKKISWVHLLQAEHCTYTSSTDPYNHSLHASLFQDGMGIATDKDLLQADGTIRYLVHVTLQNEALFIGQME